MSFSDPVYESPSDAVSFDEDDMYGTDYGMEVVVLSESSDEEQSSIIMRTSRTSTDHAVSDHPCPPMSMT